MAFFEWKNSKVWSIILCFTSVCLQSEFIHFLMSIYLSWPESKKKTHSKQLTLCNNKHLIVTFIHFMFIFIFSLNLNFIFHILFCSLLVLFGWLWLWLLNNHHYHHHYYDQTSVLEFETTVATTKKKMSHTKCD